MNSTNLRILNFHKHYPKADRVAIASVSSCNIGYFVLLNVWQRKDHRSVKQVVLHLVGTNILSEYNLPKEFRWRCIYGLGNEKFMLGSAAKEENENATLAIFEKEEMLCSRDFHKGYSTNIVKIAGNIDNTLLVHGEYYVPEKVGGHDEYWPREWTQKVTKEGDDVEVKEDPYDFICYADHKVDPSSEEGDYYMSRKNILSKYSKFHKKLWEQDVAITGEEKSTNIRQLAPYYRMQGNQLLSDGVWVGGNRMYKGGNSLGSMSFLYRVSSAGTIVRFDKLFEEFPDLKSVESVISGWDNDCFIMGESVRIEKGSGLYLMHVELCPGARINQVRYFNFLDDLQVSPANSPAYFGTFINIRKLYAVKGKNGDLRQFHVFLDISNYEFERNNSLLLTVELEM